MAASGRLVPGGLARDPASDDRLSRYRAGPPDDRCPGRDAAAIERLLTREELAALKNGDAEVLRGVGDREDQLTLARDYLRASNDPTAQQGIDRVSDALTAERDRVSGIHAASFAGYEAERDEAIRSGSTVAAFKAIVVEKEAPGGQAGTSASIQNYLGFPKGLSGADLAQRALDPRIGAQG